MSLHLSNQATPKQVEMLRKLDYIGPYNLSMSEAAEIIDELLEEQRMNQDEESNDYYDQFN